MPSEKVLQAKQAKVAALTEQLKNAAACVLVDYKGITVEDDTKLRRELREAGVSYSVHGQTYRNSLFQGRTLTFRGSRFYQTPSHHYWEGYPLCH